MSTSIRRRKEQYTVVSIDGGGIRGIFAMEFLKLLMQGLHARGKNLHDVVDLYCGVSVGSVIASLLAQHKYEFFRNFKLEDRLLKEVFAQKTVLGPALECKYQGKPKTDVLQKVLGQGTMGDLGTNLVVLVSDMVGKEIIVHSNVPLRNNNGAPPVVNARPADVADISDLSEFSVPDEQGKGKKRKEHRHKKNLTLGGDTPLYQVVDASTAAPIFFPPVHLMGRLCIDGGVVSTNPSIAGIHVMRKILQDQPAAANRHDESPVVRVLSIGSGSGNINSDLQEVGYERDPMQYGAMTWLSIGLLDLVSRSNDPFLDSVMPSLLEGSKRYIRVDTTIRSGMDDMSPEKAQLLRNNARETFKAEGLKILDWLCPDDRSKHRFSYRT